MRRLGSVCLFLGMCFIFPGIAGADTVDTSKVKETPLNFTKTAKGLALEARSGVPISGVVLYQPEAERSPRHPLDYAGPSIRCNQDSYGNTQNETPGAASPINTDNVLAGANDYRNGDASGGFYCSTDGGDSWYDALVTRGPEAYNYEGAGDPVTSVDNTGRMYAAYIAFDRTSDENGLYVQTSTDNGSSWSSPVVVVDHRGTGTYDFEDKPYAACDYAPGSPYENNYYITWTKFPTSGGSPIYFTRSTNGGTSFSTPLRISTSSSCQFSCPATGPNGEVYAVWYNYSGSNIKFDRSTDGGTTWGSDITVANFDDGFPSNPCGSFRTPSYPVIGCDISGGPYNGWIYVCWADASSGEPDIYFSRSTNGGTSWSSPAIVNDDGTSRWQWWQWMAVHPTSGNIGLSWLDRREDPAGCTYRTYATISSDGGTSWLTNFPVSDIASDPSSSTWLGDYCGTTFRSNGFYSVWVDLRNDNGDAYAAWWTNVTITVTSPNGGETWAIDQPYDITWTSEGVSGTVTIRINRSYPAGPWQNIVSGTDNDGVHSWTVTAPATSQARILIFSDADSSVRDSSDGNFTITDISQPPEVVVVRSDEHAKLHWNSTGALYYHVYSDTIPLGDYVTFEGSTSDTTFIDSSAVTDEAIKFYRVHSSTEP